MKYFKELSDSHLYQDWNCKIGSDQSIELKKMILEFMHELCSIRTTDKIYWYSPSEIKHMAEAYLNNVTTKHPYVCRDLCTAFAIALGQPVDLKSNTNHNQIGLFISKAKYHNLWHNVVNKGATDLSFAVQHSPEHYSLKLHKMKQQ